MKLILATVALVTVLASPASAQTFWVGDGTGNVLPFSYGPGGTRHGPGDPLTINPQSDQLAAGESGLYAFARVPRVRTKLRFVRPSTEMDLLARRKIAIIPLKLKIHPENPDLRKSYSTC